MSAASIPQLYRSIWVYALGARLRLLGSAGLLIGSQVIRLAVPWMTARAIDALQKGGASSLSDAAAWIGGVLFVYVAAWALHGPGRVLERSVGVQVRTSLSDALYAKLADTPLAWHERHHSADVQHRVAQSSQALSNFAQTQFIYLQSAVNFVGPLVALSLLAPSIGTLAILGYVLVALVIVRFDIVLMKLAAAENQAERRYGSGLLDFLGNITTVTSLRLQTATRRLLARRLMAVFAPLKRAMVLNEAKWCAVDILSVCLTWGLVASFAWESRAATGAVLIGTLFMIYQYAQQAGSVIGSMAANFQTFSRTRTDFASAQPIWDAPVREANAGMVGDWSRIEIRGLNYARHDGGAMPQSGAAAVDRDDAADGEEGTARRGQLDNVSLSLRRGQRIALVGPSGSGKSTLMRVLAGLYEPQGGRISIDGVPRSDMRHFGDIATLIPQEADVFESTVRENIAFDMPHDPAVLRRALRVSAFDEVLVTMADGLDTPITERGFNMSGGQRQRLCLARGVLAAKDSSLVLLDEPTSALDPMTEGSVLERINDHFADACVVASVHRMGLLKHFDTVVLMVAGRVVDSGSVDEVARRQPLFADMLHGRSTDRAVAKPTLSPQHAELQRRHETDLAEAG